MNFRNAFLIVMTMSSLQACKKDFADLPRPTPFPYSSPTPFPKIYEDLSAPTLQAGECSDLNTGYSTESDARNGSSEVVAVLQNPNIGNSVLPVIRTEFFPSRKKIATGEITGYGYQIVFSCDKAKRYVENVDQFNTKTEAISAMQVRTYFLIQNDKRTKVVKDTVAETSSYQCRYPATGIECNSTDAGCKCDFLTKYRYFLLYFKVY